jgi:tRNA nucleotidyltransferase (CCA-adding enzyme)
VETLGESFGIIQVSIPGWKEKLDTSVPRRESKIGKGHLGFKVEGDPSMTIVEAAKRRDIAINSLAYDPLTGIIYDSFGGLNDIKNKKRP